MSALEESGRHSLVPLVDVVHRSRFVKVDAVITHYLDAGDGLPIVLLHSKEFGGCAETSWEYLIPALARHFAFNR